MEIKEVILAKKVLEKEIRQLISNYNNTTNTVCKDVEVSYIETSNKFSTEPVYMLGVVSVRVEL